MIGFSDLILYKYTIIGGNVSLEDFRRYEPRVYENRFMVRLDDEYRAYITPPPSSGVLLAVLMKLMKGREADFLFCDI
jgi:gamma-glutamyltranspeptidase